MKKAAMALSLAGITFSPALGLDSKYKDVCASGCTYPSVQEALESITDSSATNVYTIFVDSGVLQSDTSIETSGKSFIHFVGRGPGVSVLQASQQWFANVDAGEETNDNFFDLTGSTNVTVTNLSIDARSKDPGNAGNTQQFNAMKVDPGPGGKVLIEGSDIQGVFYGMWDGPSASEGLVEIFNSKIRSRAYGVYVSDDKWHIYSSEIRVSDVGDASGPEAELIALWAYGADTAVWGSHIHAEGSQPSKIYPVYGIRTGPTTSAVVSVIGSTVHVKMSTDSIGSAVRSMAAVWAPFGQTHLIGTELLYENVGTLNQGKLAGLRLGTTGTINLSGCSFRDAGGAGDVQNSTRSDVLAPPTTVNLQLSLAGTRVASVKSLTQAPPAASVVKALATLSSQRGVATFAGAGSVAVTLPTNLAGGVPYSVSASANVGEVVWVTNKSDSGFTLNSSNPTSSASVDWVVTQCTLGSASCGF
ncbi:MAG TPA: hypothetical protein VFV75_17110 [Candidatus Polarisedimenticolaceae bacterium]|nr:hypothetical protein [Candidatus Polarisedimenticolaceae bacterium]